MRSILAFVILLIVELPASASPTCSSASEVSLKTLIDDSEAILVGERHGTQEMPVAFLDIVSEAILEDRTIVVALEFDAEMQYYFDVAMSSKLQKGFEILSSVLKTEDGRTSRAMRDMLLGLWRLKQSGADITVVPVDYWPSDYPEDDRPLPEWVPDSIERENTLRDVRMGQNAVEACRAVQCDLLLFYAGNVHTRTKISEGGAFFLDTGKFETFEIVPAGRVILEEMKTAAIYLTHRGGASQSTTKFGHGVRPTAPNTPDFVIEDGVIYCNPDLKALHGYLLSVGTINPSPNAYEAR